MIYLTSPLFCLTDQNEEWYSASHVIEEEDEVILLDNRVGSGKKPCRPSSAGSRQSGKEEKSPVQRTVSSAGKKMSIRMWNTHLREKSYQFAFKYIKGVNFVCIPPLPRKKKQHLSLVGVL